MRKSRILSLLLAVAVMATMLVAVPLTASAAEPITGTYETNPTASKATDYVEWLFNSASDPGYDKVDFDANFRKSGGNVQSALTSLPSMKNKGYSSGSRTKVTSLDLVTPHFSGNTGSSGYYAIKTSSSTTNGIVIKDAFEAGKGYDSYDLIVTLSNHTADDETKDITVDVHEFTPGQEDDEIASGKIGETVASCTTKLTSYLTTTTPGQLIFKGLTTPNILITINGFQTRVFAYTLDYKIHSDDPSISISPEKITAMEGDKNTVTATVENITEPKITWKSSDDTKVKVTANGEDQTQATVEVQPGISEGSVDITAECTGTNQLSPLTSNKCEITIIPQKAVVTFTGSGIVGLKGITLTKINEKDGSPVSDGSPKTYPFKRPGNQGVANVKKEIKDVEFGTYSVTAEAAEPYYTIKGQIDNVVVDSASESVSIPIEQVYVEHKISENSIANLTGTKTWSFDSTTADSKEYLNLEGSNTVSVYSDDNKVFMNVDTKTGTWYQKDNITYKTRTGKFNATQRDDCIQCNAMTYFDIPVIKGSTITIDGLDAENDSAYLEQKDDSAKAELTAQVYKIDGTTSVGQPQKLSVDTQNSKKIATYKYDGEDIKAMVRIVSAGSWLNSIKVEYPELKIFGTETGTESGYYNEDGSPVEASEDTKGVIRFFQSFAGNEEVSEYGFYFLDNNANTVGTDYNKKASELGTVNINTLDGMYGDLIDIDFDHFGTTYYALPFVKIGEDIIFGTPFDGSVGEGAKQVLKPAVSD